MRRASSHRVISVAAVLWAPGKSKRGLQGYLCKVRLHHTTLVAVRATCLAHADAGVAADAAVKTETAEAPPPPSTAAQADAAPAAPAQDGSTADNPAAAPDAPKAEVKKEEAEETFERDAAELLSAFKDDVEGSQPKQEEAVDAEALMKQFMLDMKDVDRDNEVVRVLGAFKLNPFEKLNLRFTATAAEVKRAYRCAAPALLSPAPRAPMLAPASEDWPAARRAHTAGRLRRSP